MGSVSGKSDKNNKNNNRTPPATYTRRAQHAGSWYDDKEDALNRTLQGFLDECSSSQEQYYSKNEDQQQHVCGLIVPHAGYRFSGPTAAYAYQALLQELLKSATTQSIEQILVLHPSHHVYLKGCAVSNAHVLETPFGNLTTDATLRTEISQLLFSKQQQSPNSLYMTQFTDEAEHSGEMQYPFIAKVLKDTDKLNQITVTPVMCGALSTQDEITYGTLLSEIIARPTVLTIVSSDFCHWGKRFQYQPTDSNNSMPIHEFIEQMDRQAMNLIELQQPGAFADYLKQTQNTICGRHAIAVWMRAIEHHATKNKTNCSCKVQFVQYAQSSPAKNMHDSSVSYAAAVMTTKATTKNDNE